MSLPRGNPVRDQDRERFDEIVEAEISSLPAAVRAWVEQVPVIVLDEPTNAMLADLGVPPHAWSSERENLCGLHSGVALPDRSVDHPEHQAGDQIHLFRKGIIAMAGGWRAGTGNDERLIEEIRITLLHELGHHFGLEEDDLDELGYG